MYQLPTAHCNPEGIHNPMIVDHKQCRLPVYIYNFVFATRRDLDLAKLRPDRRKVIPRGGLPVLMCMHMGHSNVDMVACLAAPAIVCPVICSKRQRC